MATRSVDRGTMKTTRLRKIECPICGLILRGSRNPIVAGGMPQHCGVEMQWADLEDAYACLEGPELYLHPLVRDEEALADRRLARRAPAHVKRNTVGQCGGCCKPVKATNEHCPCGFKNDIRGPRNQGGYAEASYVAGFGSDGMPF